MDVKEGDGETSKKKVRPAVQLYRPGMLKTGTDITVNKPKVEHRNVNVNSSNVLNANSKRPPKVPLTDNSYKQKQYQGTSGCSDAQSVRLGSRYSSTRGRGRGRGGGGRRDRNFDEHSLECNSISSIDGNFT
ncbi:unnamed protein product [Enterobius vermicularis]|uniref:SUZ domain-containing protein n=1 Tax=Enterobius vermicularis TaxID=51028 RepID=A0A158Q9M2_ENTVE|nr:unnamed protein product [Enterobius vermicularis]